MNKKTEDKIYQAYGFIIDEKDQVLLVEELDGSWSIPGGAVENFDENIEAGLQRELQEELNLDPNDYQVENMGIRISFLYDRPSGSRYGKIGVIDMFLVILNDDAEFAAQKAHVKSFLWCTQEETENKLEFHQHHELIDQGFKYYRKIKTI